MLSAGWSRPDEWGVWNDGRAAELLIRPRLDQPVDFDVRLFVCPYPGLGRTRSITVGVGEKEVLRTELGNPDGEEVVVRVARDSLVEKTARLVFSFANPESPRSAGLSDDARELALRLVVASIHPVDPD